MTPYSLQFAANQDSLNNSFNHAHITYESHYHQQVERFGLVPVPSDELEELLRIKAVRDKLPYAVWQCLVEWQPNNPLQIITH